MKYLILLYTLNILFNYNINENENTISGAYSNSTSSNLRLSIDSQNKIFSLIQYGDSFADDIVSVEWIMKGTLYIEKDFIVCKNNNKEYRIKALNEEMIVNYDLDLMEDTLYIVQKRNSNLSKPEITGRWKNGKKDGYWYFYPENGDPYWILYKEGMILFAMKVLI